MVRALNVAQFAKGSKTYCVSDLVCAGLLQPDMDDDVVFATKLFRTLLGYDSELWPKALGITMHLDLSHFCTLCLIATLQKLYVFDSLRTSDDSRGKIRLLAKRLRIDPANVEYRSMVMQSEIPYTLCLYFSCGVLNGIRQDIIPDPVSCSFFFVFSVGLLMSRNVYCAQGANDQCFMSSNTPDLWRDATLCIIEKGALPDSLIFDSKLANLPGTEGNDHVKYWKQFKVWHIFVTSRPFWLYDLTLRTLLGI